MSLNREQTPLQEEAVPIPPPTNDNEATDGDSESSDESGAESASADDSVHEPRYPRRVCVARQIDGAILWEAVPLR